MAFQRSYSKVWWGSDNQLPTMFSTSTAASSSQNTGNSLTSGGYYSSYFSQQQQPQQQMPYQRQQQQQHKYFDSNGNSSNGGYHSLDFNNFKSYPGNLSRIQEVDDEQNISKISWGKRDSPGSLRSQDSGFSDNDESHSTRSLGGGSPKTSPNGKSTELLGSPVSTRSIATPPTVIRRVNKTEFYSPLVSVSRRISFTGSPASVANKATRKADASYEEASIEGATLMAQLDSMQLLNSSNDSNDTEANKTFNDKLNFDDSKLSALSSEGKSKTAEVGGGVKPKRRRRVIRTATKPLTPTKRRTLVDDKNDGSINDVSENEDDIEVNDENGNSRFDELEKEIEHNDKIPAYNNETVYLGAAAPRPYNNETFVLGRIDNDADNTVTLEDSNNNSLSFGDDISAAFKAQQRYTASTSTPKASRQNLYEMPEFLRKPKYENPLLNGQTPVIQAWLGDLRMSYEQEVMSTLQTKSISQEAFKNLTITTNTVAKLIRQLQQRAMYMQSDFERIERILTGDTKSTLHAALVGAEQLVDNVVEFIKVLERRAVFFTDSRVDRKRYETNIEQIRIITKDTRYSLEKQHYINLESLLDDVQVLKRYLLITIRLVFEKMVRVIVQSIENGHCDLMLRANINMIATLTNIDYEGFASLTDAFVQNEAVRALLIVCLENRSSSVRALALRALATICCAPAAITQLSACGGVEIMRDILQVQSAECSTATKRGDTERREAVSLLTQITAVWHGPDHRVEGLKEGAETIIEGLTHLIGHTTCTQTLLLCAAALNNFSRIDRSSHYSIMSNEAIFRVIEALERKEDSVTIFLYEQIVAMLHNMSLNKKCHSHLANGSIINFITSTYQKEFYKIYNSRAENDAQHRIIKAILHTLTRLVHDSPCLGVELLEQERIPAFFKLAIATSTADGIAASRSGTKANMNAGDGQTSASFESTHSRDISLLARQLLLAQKQQREQQSLAKGGGKSTAATAAASEGDLQDTMSSLRFNLTRQESYV